MNKRIFALLPVLLAALIIAAAGALADGEGGLNLSVTSYCEFEGTDSADNIKDGVVSGSYYYVGTVTLPESADGVFQDGWSERLDAAEPDEWLDEKTEYYSGAKTGFSFLSLPPESDSDKYFIRLYENEQDVRSLVLNYNKSARDETIKIGRASCRERV